MDIYFSLTFLGYFLDISWIFAGSPEYLLVISGYFINHIILALREGVQSLLRLSFDMGQGDHASWCCGSVLHQTLRYYEHERVRGAICFCVALVSAAVLNVRGVYFIWLGEQPPGPVAYTDSPSFDAVVGNPRAYNLFPQLMI